MDTIYLIEIRLARTKWRIKKSIYAIAGFYRLGKHMERHPHVTIFGPLVLNKDVSEDLLLNTLGEIAARYDPFPFMLDGWEHREGIHGSVIAFPVHPSESLILFTRSVADALLPISESLNHWDAMPEKKWFHVTLANRLEKELAQEISAFLKRPDTEIHAHHHEPPGWKGWFRRTIGAWFSPCRANAVPVLLDETGLRLTVMKGEEILAEYDLIDKCWISSDTDHKSSRWQSTLRKFRRQEGFERTPSAGPETEGVFVISDLHLGHANIIRYCSRPFLFSDVEEMNRVLIGNWNSVVTPDTRIYHVGDLRYGAESLPVQDYRSQLRGRITFIEGNHDDHELDAVPHVTLDYGGFRFLLIHDPANAPSSFDGWVIHGHHHNNDLRNFPFMNFSARRINVSAEVLGYVPISLDEICTRIRKQQGSGTTESLLLRYPHVR
jgi:calcineurin-like phosphoesterase family protein